MTVLPQHEIAAFLAALPAYEREVLEALLALRKNRRVALRLLALERGPGTRPRHREALSSQAFERTTAQTLERAQESEPERQLEARRATETFHEIWALASSERVERAADHPFGASLQLAFLFLDHAEHGGVSLDERTEALDLAVTVADRASRAGEELEAVDHLLWRADVARAEILRELGDGEAALGLLRFAADRLPAYLELPERAGYNRAAARIYEALGLWDESVALYTRAARLASEAGEVTAAAADWCAAAALLAEGNAPLEALDFLHRAQSVWVGEIPQEVAGLYWSALGRAHLGQGDPLRATWAALRLRQAAGAIRNLTERGRWLAAAARLSADLGEHAAARAGFISALGALQAPSVLRLSIQLDATGFLLAQGGKPATSIALANWLDESARGLCFHPEGARALARVVETLRTTAPPAQSAHLACAAAAYFRRAEINPLLTFRPEAWV